MKFGSMFSDVLPSLFASPMTELYPFERREPPERLRALLHWYQEQCTGCGLCVMDCPAQALEILTLDRKAKRFVLTFHVDRCTFCSQCTHSCRQGSLTLSNQGWELAALAREPLTFVWGQAEDVRRVLAGELPAEGGAPQAT
jgi:formate hydrogenlyase subunit 6/NADH:ubiquinone oxidoreductase subunit I